MDQLKALEFIILEDITTTQAHLHHSRETLQSVRTVISLLEVKECDRKMQDWVKWQQVHHLDIKVDNTRSDKRMVYVQLKDKPWLFSLVVPVDNPTCFELMLKVVYPMVGFARPPPKGLDPNECYQFQTNEQVVDFIRQYI
jgi:hypothetical protein